MCTFNFDNSGTVHVMAQGQEIDTFDTDGEDAPEILSDTEAAELCPVAGFLLYEQKLAA